MAVSSRERALLVQVATGRETREEAADSLAELERLADTAGATVTGSITQRRDRPNAGFFVGEGKLSDIQLACRKAQADLVIFDNDLSPVQVNNLDLALGLKVIDRTELILHIFARRARTAEAQIQVELAQLQYLVSRIPVSEKQARFTGGIGMRGPGESPFQLRAAPMRRRISDLKRKLDRIGQHRTRTRTRRAGPLVCLVGYTNAGKSTLLNAFAAANAYVDDRLFATLDTKTRRVRLAPGREILLSDTVGFIRHLPHGLIASFRSTLDVAVQADALLVVADAGDRFLPDHLSVVGETLKEIGADTVPSVLVLNKCDTEDAGRVLPGLSQAYPGAIPVSALRREGLESVKEAVLRRLSDSPAAEP
jgi:GTP-binding protein HflX